MSSFGSAVISKSNKKFAPKAPTQRKRPAVPTVPQSVTTSNEDGQPASERAPSPERIATTAVATHTSGLGHEAISDAHKKAPVVHKNVKFQVEGGGHGDVNEPPAKRRRIGEEDTEEAIAEEQPIQAEPGEGDPGQQISASEQTSHVGSEVSSGDALIENSITSKPGFNGSDHTSIRIEPSTSTSSPQLQSDQASDTINAVMEDVSERTDHGDTNSAVENTAESTDIGAQSQAGGPEDEIAIADTTAAPTTEQSGPPSGAGERDGPSETGERSLGPAAETDPISSGQGRDEDEVIGQPQLTSPTPVEAQDGVTLDGTHSGRQEVVPRQDEGAAVSNVISEASSTNPASTSAEAVDVTPDVTTTQVREGSPQQGHSVAPKQKNPKPKLNKKATEPSVTTTGQTDVTGPHTSAAAGLKKKAQPRTQRKKGPQSISEGIQGDRNTGEPSTTGATSDVDTTADMGAVDHAAANTATVSFTTPMDDTATNVTARAATSAATNAATSSSTGDITGANTGANTGAGVTKAAVKKASKPRKKRIPKSSRTVVDEDDDENQENNATSIADSINAGATNSAAKKARKTRKTAASKRARTALNENADDNAENPPDTNADSDSADETENAVAKRRGRKRDTTPEGAEDVEINLETTTMFELCKDTRQGKKSHREAEFQNIDWTEVIKRRKAAEAKARAGEVDEQAREEAERRKEAAERQKQGPRGPQLRLINGQMVLDTDSLVVNRRAAVGGVDEDAVEENDLTRRINSATWMYDNRRDPEERYASSAKSEPWSEDQTEQFYDAIRMFGTDFFIISRMFPGKSRRMIKNKFVREERSDPTRIRAALIGESVPMNMAAYCEATGKEEWEFKNPEQLEQELREQDETQKAEIEKQKSEQAEKAKSKQEAAKAKADGSKGKKRKAKPKGGDAGGEEVPMPGEGEVAVAGTAGS